MLLQRQAPLATRCSAGWRFVTASVAALLLGASTLCVGVNTTYAHQFGQDRDEEVARMKAERDELRREIASLRAAVQELRAMNQQLQAANAQAADAQAATAAQNERLTRQKLEEKVEEEQPANAARKAIERRTSLQREQLAVELGKARGEAVQQETQQQQPRQSRQEQSDGGGMRPRSPRRMPTTICWMVVNRASASASVSAPMTLTPSIT